MLQLVTGPSSEPLSLAEAYGQLRTSSAELQDGKILRAIRAARAACETRTQNRLMAQRWKYVLDSFPGTADGAAFSYIPWGRTVGIPGNAIVLPIGPVLQVVSITYLDMAGATQTLAAGQANDYVVESSGQLTRITPPFGKIWPANLMPQVGSVVVTFDVGHAALATVDATADTIYVPGWKTLAVADTLRLTNRDKTTIGDGGFPGGLAGYTDYFVQTVVSADKYKVSATSGGGAIDITSAGTGETLIGEVPGNLADWMLLAAGTLYENRESISVDVRINQVELAPDFMEGLLDPHRIILY